MSPKLYQILMLKKYVIMLLCLQIVIMSIIATMFPNSYYV